MSHTQTTFWVLFLIVIGFIVCALQYHHNLHNFLQTDELRDEDFEITENLEINYNEPTSESIWDLIWSSVLTGNGSSSGARVKRRIWLSNETLPGVSGDNSSAPAVAPASGNGSTGSNDTAGGGVAPSKPRGFSIIRLLNKNYTLIKEKFWAAVANGTIFPNGTLVNPEPVVALNGTAAENNGTAIASGNGTAPAAPAPAPAAPPPAPAAPTGNSTAKP